MSGNCVTKGHDHGSFKVELHLSCNSLGCQRKARRAASSFEGVKPVEYDVHSNKLTVVGKVDPMKLQAREKEKGKKVALISPLPTNDFQAREKEKGKKVAREKEKGKKVALISPLPTNDFQAREKEKGKKVAREKEKGKKVALISPLPKDGSSNKVGQTLRTKLSYEANMQQKLVAVTSGFNKAGSKITKIQQFETMTNHKCSINQSENNLRHDDKLMKQEYYSKSEAFLGTIGFNWSTHKTI